MSPIIVVLILVAKVRVHEFAVDKAAYFALIASSDPLHVAISSRSELVRCSDSSGKGERERKREAAKEKKAFSASSAAQKVQKLGIPLEESLSWHLSKNFNEDPMLRQNLKEGARFISAIVNSSPEILVQTLLLRNHLVDSKLIPVKLALLRRLDTAIASALIEIGIGAIIEHPAFSPFVLDTLLDVCVSKKQQKLLPDVFKLLKKCCSDIMRGKALKAKVFSTLPRLFAAVSHGFGSSSGAALDMIFRFIAPLANEQSSGGSIIKQMIVPRFVTMLRPCHVAVLVFLKHVCTGGLLSIYSLQDLSAKSSTLPA